ncbi:large ribosomal subunit protein bL12m-like isoform X1 [Montipora foliosa]|uniref:large ribosomal subunit protein bL12m-like isoform X1 n=1 Tax=Montipora foliosa TaxID=591990 RepID=UPI0035F1A3C5
MMLFKVFNMAAKAGFQSLRLLTSSKAQSYCCLRYTWCAFLQRWKLDAGCVRYDSTLAAPLPDNAAKEYPKKIRGIVEEISKLTLLEVSDLNELLKSTLKIEATPMMPMMGAMPMAAAPSQEAEAEPEKNEPTEFTIKLTQFDAANKVKLIKEIKNLMPGLNLVQAKKFVEELPQNVKEKASKEEVEEIKKVLEAVGGTVEIEV